MNLFLTFFANHGRYSWMSKLPQFKVQKDGYQSLIIPVSALYKIELVAPGSWFSKIPGVRIVAKFKLERGQVTTAALGQRGDHCYCGSDGSFLTLKSSEGQRPLLIAVQGWQKYAKILSHNLLFTNFDLLSTPKRRQRTAV